MLCFALFFKQRFFKEWLCFGFCPFRLGNFVSLQTPPNPTPSLWMEGTGSIERPEGGAAAGLGQGPDGTPAAGVHGLGGLHICM